MASEKLQVILELVTGNYKREAGEAATATGRIGNAASGVTSTLRTMVGPAAIGAAITGLAAMALKAGENADRLFDLAAQTGLTTDALQEYEFVAKTAGANTEVFADAVKAVIRNLSTTQGATGAAAKAYDTLGIAVLDAGGNLRDAGTITDEVFAKLAGMENITARNALAQDIFGKKWEETVSVLDLGTDAIQAAKDEAHELGAVVSGDSLRGADRFRQSFEKLKTVLEGKLMEILGDLGPVLADVADEIGDIVTEMKPLLDGLGWLIQRYDDLKGGLDDAKDSENDFIQFLGEAGDTIIGFGGGIGTLVGGIDSITGALDGNTGASQEVHDSWQQLQDIGILLVPAITGTLEPLDRLTTAQRLAGDATKFHFEQLTRLGDFLAGKINPILAARDAIIALADAQKVAEDAARDSGKESEEFALAQVEVALKTAEAEAALGTFGANAPASIDAVAQALGITDDQAQTLLETLGLLDGKTVTTTIISRQVNLLEQGVIPEGMGISNSPRAIAGLRAAGGSVTAGRPYMVGERGPEMMVPNQSGSILPNGWNRPNSTINVYSPVTQNLAQDLQLATILATVNTMVEVQG